MKYPDDKKWAIVSQITSVGWIITVIATLKKKRSRLLNCYLNNGVAILIYGFILAALTDLLKDWYKNLEIPLGPMAPKINYYLFLFAPYVYYILMILIEGIYIFMVFGGLFFSIKGEERRIPYLFRMKIFEKINLFKADGEEDIDSFDTHIEDESDSSQDFQNDSSEETGSAAMRASQSIRKAAGEFVSKITRPNKEKVCPSCGRIILAEDEFCTYCGTRLQEKDTRKPENSRITVAEYMNSIKDYTCEKCGEKITGNDKFCPGCGGQVVIKVKPNTCLKCGKKLTEDFDFCPGCGTMIDRIALQSKCRKCGADLIFGKEYCVNCGTRVGDEIIDSDDRKENEVF